MLQILEYAIHSFDGAWWIVRIEANPSMTRSSQGVVAFHDAV
jgi:hypothetical protein